MPRFDEDMTYAEWSAQERRIDIENAERDERDHRFRDDAEDSEQLHQESQLWPWLDSEEMADDAS